MEMTIVRFNQPLRAMRESFPCSSCWPKLSMTDRCDDKGRPLCAKCAADPNHKCAMPFFVVQHLSEYMQ